MTLPLNAFQLRELATRARSSRDGLRLHWPADPLDPSAPSRAARQVASLWASLGRSKDAPTGGLALSRFPEDGGYTVTITHALATPIDALLSDLGTGEAITDFTPDALEAQRLALICAEMGGAVCPLSPSEALHFWKHKPDVAAALWEQFQWPDPR
jgi:hypothetical protein